MDIYAMSLLLKRTSPAKYIFCHLTALECFRLLLKILKKLIMDEVVTKEDLRQFGVLMMNNFREAIQDIKAIRKDGIQLEWLKSKGVRKILDMSPGSLQNLRITGKIRFKKVLGSYYYNKSDIEKLFNDDQQTHGNT
jgi:DNA-directed RNA polymerase subunit F